MKRNPTKLIGTNRNPIKINVVRISRLPVRIHVIPIRINGTGMLFKSPEKTIPISLQVTNMNRNQ